MKSIDEHINKDIEELLEAELTHEQDGKVRHLQNELDELYKYKENHPGDTHDPSSIELFCENHPDDVMCRVYED